MYLKTYVDTLVESRVGERVAIRPTDGWPPDFDTKKALALGFIRDSSMEEVINAFIEDELSDSIMKN